MSPEQGSAQPVDARTDVFSLGAVLYELVSGQPAFRAASDLASLAAVMLQDPPPLPADVPAPLAHLITRCLRKDPARRVQSMSDLKAALEDIESELRASNRAPSARAHRWLSVAVMAVLAAAAVVLWRPWRTQQDAPRLEAAALTTLPGRELYRSFSPDGDHVVFAWTPPGGENQDIYVQLIGSGDPSRRTTDPAHDYNPVWSPDGKWIAFFRSLPPAPTGLRARELRVIPALGGADRKIADIRSHDFFPVASYIAWAPDSSALIVTDTAGEGRPDLLTFVPLDGGAKRPLLFPHADVMADTSPALSPDGRLLAFIRRTSWASGELHAVAVRGDLTTDGQPRQLAGRDVRPDGPAWAADGRTIVFGGRGGLWRVPADGSEPASRLQYVGEDGAMPAISNASADGTSRLLYVRSFVDTNLWRIDTPAPGAAAPSVPVQVVASTKHEFHVAFAPDGARLAFVSSRSGEQEIWLAARDGSNVTQLTSLEAIDTNCPAWSPDGGIVAFSSNAAGEFDVYVVPSTGGKPRRLTTHPAIDLCPSYSLDGRWIYFTSTRSGDYRTWKMPRDGGEAVPVSPGHGGRAFESRDGSVYYLTVSVSSPLWRLPAAGGEPIKALDGVLWFNVAPVEGGVYYIDAADGTTRLRYFEFASGRSVTIASNLGDVSAFLSASPDGRTIVFSRIDTASDDLMLVERFR